MLISIRHVTRYSYAEPVTYTIQSLRLTPATFEASACVDWQVRVPDAGPPLNSRTGSAMSSHLVAINARHEG